MSIITISRGSYSKGKQVAEALAHELDYECLSREVLIEASDQFNIPEIKLIKALHDSPKVLERFNHGQERFLKYFKSSFLSHITKGNIVYHGLAGQFFLQNISHVLKVRIINNMSERVAEEMKREHCPRDAALYNLKKDDEERRKWSLHLHGKDTWDSRLYDMVLSIDSLTVDDVVEILVNTVKKKQFQETSKSLAELKQITFLANIEAQVSLLSPYTKVKLLSATSIELTNIHGHLQYEKSARQEFTKTMKEKFNLEEVYFGEHIHPYKGHINPFYNIDTK